MEGLKRARRPVRWEFDKLHRELENLLKEVPLREDLIAVKLKLLSDNFEFLRRHDGRVMEQMIVDGASVEDENKEYEEMLEYKSRFETLRLEKEKLIPEKSSYTESVNPGSENNETRVRNFKLPTIEMKRFTGNLNDWLAWWAQFQKIDEDLHMHGSDKFWYLLQSLEPGTDAHEIVMGYPQSNENYSKAITALKRRYGNEDMLLQVYIRQLLNLVITNVNAKEKIPIKNLYIKLDSHLRALKTLNLEKADPATWLFPLVESSLPEKILDNWQRSPLSSCDGSKEQPPCTRLELLMRFLEKEVDIKQRIDLTRDFANEQVREKAMEPRVRKTIQRKSEGVAPMATLSSFHNIDKSCVFCGRNNHESRDCFRAREMSYESKMDILRKKNLCYRCCGHHRVRDCRNDKMQCKVCKRSHHTVLCKDLKPKRLSSFQEKPFPKRAKTEDGGDHVAPQANSSNVSIGASQNVLLQTLMVKIRNGDNEINARAFIDSGCDKSYISTRAAGALQLDPIGIVRSIHSLFGGNKTSTITHKRHTINLKSFDESFGINAEVREQATICGTMKNLSSMNPELIQELREKNVKLTDTLTPPRDIDLLIGADIYPHIVTGRLVKLNCGAVAIFTKLGWTLIGELEHGDDREENMACASISMCVNNTQLASIWELETLGIREPAEESAIRQKIELARDNYIASITRDNDGRYVAKLPWKEELPALPSNRDVAFKRLQSATRKLIENELFEAYNSIFKEWEAVGFIEKASSDVAGNRVHYLPHRPVVKKESLTTPVRPVFDASCHVGKAPSLNDCLFTGENCTQLIYDLLLRFREKKIAFIADIKKAFQMVGLNSDDRDAVRFLWWANSEKKEVIEYRHARVVFGVTCSPFILAAVLYRHLSTLPDAEREIGEKILSTLYVDNCVSSEHTVEEYHYFRHKSVSLLKEAAMDLRLWQSNVEEIDDEKSRVVSVLGYLWDRRADVLFVNTKAFITPEKVTKRSILSAVQKLFDPLGFISPCLLPMKMLLQKAWVSKWKWDEELPEQEKKSFLSWCKEVPEISGIQLPRLATDGVGERNNWHIIVFTDGSKDGYAATVFLRIQQGEEVNVQLVCSKSRVTPAKKMTIPKLELMSCLLGARLSNTVKAALKVEGVRESFYSDSTTAIAWIQRGDQWGTFVANRVREINKLTKPEDWRHIPGIYNPGDLPSRGCTPHQLLTSRWYEGPGWLYQDETEWPQGREQFNEEEICAEKKKAATVAAVTSFCVITRVRNSHSFAMLVRIMGWVRRFLHNKLQQNREKRKIGNLTRDELNTAEILLLREIQRSAFPKNDRDKLRGLEIFEDEWGVLRVRTRLTYREDLANFRYPVLLPNNRDEVKRLILDMHRAYCHAGVGFLMVKLRKKYWVIKGRHTIRGVISRCERCRRHAAKPIVPIPAPLPMDRVKEAEVFEVVGVDLAGPLHLKNGSKAWLVIFTCGVYRAVHFELVKKISTSAFVAALETFTEKYRRPAIIYSDNGTNFRGADNLFKKINWNDVEQKEKILPIEWKFNPVTSSWWGGWWERLIRTAKDLLKRTVGKGSVNWNELKAILKTVEEAMNSRPLTYVSEDSSDLEPLTPSHFLHPFGRASLPEREITEAEKLRMRLKYVNTLRRELKDRFKNEYISMLINRTPKIPTRELQVGELVFIGSDCVKRVEWPMGRVSEIIPGKDGNVRLARVLTEKGEILRSVQRLYPLEADAESDTIKLMRKKTRVTKNEREVKRMAQASKTGR